MWRPLAARCAPAGTRTPSACVPAPALAFRPGTTGAASLGQRQQTRAQARRLTAHTRQAHTQTPHSRKAAPGGVVVSAVAASPRPVDPPKPARLHLDSFFALANSVDANFPGLIGHLWACVRAVDASIPAKERPRVIRLRQARSPAQNDLVAGAPTYSEMRQAMGAGIIKRWEGAEEGFKTPFSPRRQLLTLAVHLENWRSILLTLFHPRWHSLFDPRHSVVPVDMLVVTQLLDACAGVAARPQTGPSIWPVDPQTSKPTDLDTYIHLLLATWQRIAAQPNRPICTPEIMEHAAIASIALWRSLTPTLLLCYPHWHSSLLLADDGRRTNPAVQRGFVAMILALAIRIGDKTVLPSLQRVCTDYATFLLELDNESLLLPPALIANWTLISLSTNESRQSLATRWMNLQRTLVDSTDFGLDETSAEILLLSLHRLDSAAERKACATPLQQLLDSLPLTANTAATQLACWRLRESTAAAAYPLAIGLLRRFQQSKPPTVTLEIHVEMLKLLDLLHAEKASLSLLFANRQAADPSVGAPAGGAPDPFSALRMLLDPSTALLQPTSWLEVADDLQREMQQSTLKLHQYNRVTTNLFLPLVQADTPSVQRHARALCWSICRAIGRSRANASPASDVILETESVPSDFSTSFSLQHNKVGVLVLTAGKTILRLPSNWRCVVESARDITELVYRQKPADLASDAMVAAFRAHGWTAPPPEILPIDQGEPTDAALPAAPKSKARVGNREERAFTPRIAEDREVERTIAKDTP